MKAVKIAKILFVFTILSVFLTAGLLGGIRVEQGRLKQEEQLETVDEIAIVNLDEGIYMADGKVNYAAELMEFPGDNFVSTGLEEARNGIYNGSYAAYIIIPASFSANAESINSVPQKSILEYAVNPNLKSQVSNRVIADINNFESTISRNLSYMYVDAVLKEFHGVQDSAKVIMKNDEKDLQALLQVDPSQLIELLEISELERVEDEIEGIDLSEIYSNNQKTIEEANEKVKESLNQGQEEFEKVKGEEEKVLQSAEELISEAGNIDLLEADDGTMIYEDGLNKVEDYVTGYNMKNREEKQALKEQLGWEENEGDKADEKEGAKLISTKLQAKIDIELEKIKDFINKKADEFNVNLKSWKEYFTEELYWIENAVKEAEEKDTVSGNVPTVSGNMPTVSGNMPLMDYEEVFGKIENMLDEVNGLAEINIMAENAEIDMKAVTEEPFGELIYEIENLTVFEQTKVEEIFEKEIVDRIQENSESEMNKLTENTEKVADEMTAFTQAMEEYDPFQYYEEGEITDSFMKVNENLETVEMEMNQKGMDYRDYAEKVYEIADENSILLREDIEDAYKGTTEKVNAAMALVKKDREEVNRNNKEILSDFSGKLPYTRLGNVEYTQAYDFIVSPLKSENKTVEKKKGITALYEYENIRSILIVLIALSVLEGLFLITGRLMNQSKGE